MTVYISRGVNRQYTAQVRSPGMRRWSTVYETRSYRMAVEKMADKFARHGYKRGRVLLTADYYEPIIVAEISR